VWDDEDAGAQLADEIRLSIDYYMTQAQARSVCEVILSGPGSTEPELVESLGVHLGIPTTVAAPLGTLDVAALSGGDDPHRFTVAAGLAMGAAA
jgi:type IV pilus assembly protein PilM